MSICPIAILVNVGSKPLGLQEIVKVGYFIEVEDPSDEIAVRVATQQFQLLQAAYEVLSDQSSLGRS